MKSRFIMGQIRESEWSVWDTWNNRYVIRDESYTVASRVIDRLNGQPGERGECEEVADNYLEVQS